MRRLLFLLAFAPLAYGCHSDAGTPAPRAQYDTLLVIGSGRSPVIHAADSSKLTVHYGLLPHVSGQRSFGVLYDRAGGTSDTAIVKQLLPLANQPIGFVVRTLAGRPAPVDSAGQFALATVITNDSGVARNVWQRGTKVACYWLVTQTVDQTSGDLRQIDSTQACITPGPVDSVIVLSTGPGPHEQLGVTGDSLDLRLVVQAVKDHYGNFLDANAWIDSAEAVVVDAAGDPGTAPHHTGRYVPLPATLGVVKLAIYFKAAPLIVWLYRS